MKITLLILIFFSILTVENFAQNLIDPQRLFQKDTLAILDNRPNTFIKGWNWCPPGRALDKAMLMNTYHRIPWSVYNQDNSDVEDSIKYIPELGIGTQRDLITRKNNSYLNGMALVLEPTLQVDETNGFKPKWNDKTGSVFGFRYRNFDSRNIQ